MTSRRSEDNATTADWRSEKDGLYFDSTWPADSQGRKQPASTQITVTPSASILETSRAAQAANRERLDRRENENKVKAEAVQEIKREEAEQKLNKKEVTRGVPENKTRTVLPKRKGKPIFSWIIQEFKSRVAAGTGNRLEVLGSNLSASGNIMTHPSAFEIYRFYDPLALDAPFQLPASYTTYDKAIPSSPFPGQDTLLHISAFKSTKDRLYFEVAGSLESYVENTGIKPHFDIGNDYRTSLSWQVGLYFDARKLSKSSYVYFFAKEKNPGNDTSLNELMNVREGFFTLAGLDPESRYPQPTHITGDPSKIFIKRHEFTKTIKETFMNISTDRFGRPTTRRTFEWERPGTYRIEGGVSSGFNRTYPYPDVAGGFYWVIDSPAASTFHDQIELIYTDKDYGELIWAE